MTLLFYLSILTQRDTLRSAVLAQASSTGTGILSDGKRHALGVIGADGRLAVFRPARLKAD